MSSSWVVERQTQISQLPRDILRSRERRDSADIYVFSPIGPSLPPSFVSTWVLKSPGAGAPRSVWVQQTMDRPKSEREGNECDNAWKLPTGDFKIRPWIQSVTHTDTDRGQSQETCSSKTCTTSAYIKLTTHVLNYIWKQTAKAAVGLWWRDLKKINE